MHDIVAWLEFTEIRSGPSGDRTLPAQGQPLRAQRRAPSKQLGIGKNRELCRGADETPRERQLEKHQSGDIMVMFARQLLEALDLTIAIGQHRDQPAVMPPFLKLAEKLAAPCGVQHEVPGMKLREWLGKESGGVVFTARIQDDLAPADRPGADDQVCLADIILQQAKLPIQAPGQDLAAIQRGDGYLRIRVKFPDGLNPVVIQLHAEGQRRLPGVNVENASAHGELPARADLGGPLVSGGGQLLGRLLQPDDLIPRELQDRSGDGLGRWHMVSPLPGVNDDRTAVFLASEHLEELQPLSRGLRISQYHIFLGLGRLQLGKNARGGIPDREFGRKGLLGFEGRAFHPGPPGRLGPDHQAGHKRLRRFTNLRECARAFQPFPENRLDALDDAIKRQGRFHDRYRKVSARWIAMASPCRRAPAPAGCRCGCW